MRYISDLKADERVIEHYLCKQRQSMKSRAGKTYLSLKLQDKTGMIDAKVWELNHDIQCFTEGDFIKVDGIVLTYQNELQLKISKIRKSMPGEYEPMNYIPCTDKNVDSMYAEIAGYIKTLNNTYIRTLMENILLDDELVSKAFKENSAAKNLHHSYMGGLIEHTLNVVEICDYLAPRYKFVNRDILISTAILHDLGKVYELSPFPNNDYTDDGQLLGHIVICSEMISKAAAKIPGFPPRLLSLIKHSILSHHGEYEFGSPKRPKTIEAFILHCADNIDARLKMFEEFLESDSTPGDWIGYSRILARNITKTEF